MESLKALLYEEDRILNKVRYNGDMVVHFKQAIDSGETDMKEYYKKEYNDFIIKRDESLHKLNEIRRQIKEYLEMLSNY